MKKTYESPRVYLEQFATNSFASNCVHHIVDRLDNANCINPQHYPNGKVPQYQNDVLENHMERKGSTTQRGRVTQNVFTEAGSICISCIPTGMRLSGGYFPKNNGQVFVLNDKTDVRVAEALDYPNNDSRCYGSYWVPGSTDNIYQPHS